MSDPFLGEIRMVGFNFAPKGWALCDGQLLPISQNSALFALLGTTFGGNGVQSFGLPDYRSRGPVGMGVGPGLTPVRQGESAGSQSVTIQIPNMPAHTHMATAAMPSAASGATTADPTGAVPATAQTAERGVNYPIYGATTAITGTMAPFNVNVAPAGAGQPLPILNPYLGTNFIIALEGIFPSRP